MHMHFIRIGQKHAIAFRVINIFSQYKYIYFDK